MLDLDVHYQRSKVLTDAGGTDLVQTMLKLCEETGELSRAILLSTKPAAGTYRHEEGSPEHINEEIVDVMMSCMSLLHLNGTKTEDLEALLLLKFKKWEQKIKEAQP